MSTSKPSNVIRLDERRAAPAVAGSPAFRLRATCPVAVDDGEECGGDLLPRVEGADTRVTAHCAKCKTVFVSKRSYAPGWYTWEHTKPKDADVTTIRGQRVSVGDSAVVPFVAQVELDGTVRFSVKPGEHVVSVAFVRAMSTVLSGIASEAQKQERHLAGQDRWVARPDGGGYLVSHMGTTRRFVQRRTGQRKAPEPFRCVGCGEALPSGSTVYRPEKPRYAWHWPPASGQVLCPRCVTGK